MVCGGWSRQRRCGEAHEARGHAAGIQVNDADVVRLTSEHDPDARRKPGRYRLLRRPRLRAQIDTRAVSNVLGQHCRDTTGEQDQQGTKAEVEERIKPIDGMSDDLAGVAVYLFITSQGHREANDNSDGHGSPAHVLKRSAHLAQTKGTGLDPLLGRAVRNTFFDVTGRTQSVRRRGGQSPTTRRCQRLPAHTTQGITPSGVRVSLRADPLKGHRWTLVPPPRRLPTPLNDCARSLFVVLHLRGHAAEVQGDQWSLRRPVAIPRTPGGFRRSSWSQLPAVLPGEPVEVRHPLAVLRHGANELVGTALC